MLRRSHVPLGAQKFDPLYIMSQIATLQCLFYLSLGLILFTADMMLGLMPILSLPWLCKLLLPGAASLVPVHFVASFHSTSPCGEMAPTLSLLCCAFDTTCL